MCVEDKNAKKNDVETQENDETGGLGGVVDHRKLVACYAINKEAEKSWC